jgi:hypothetical protein
VIDCTNFREDLKILAHHEVGHGVVARLLGRHVHLIEMVYVERARKWGGLTMKDELPQTNETWTKFNPDASIPYADLQFQYPHDPEPCEEYKIVRELSAIAYAGIVAEELLYKQNGIDGNPEKLEENTNDINVATNLIKQKFAPSEWERELCYAKEHARSILSKPLIRQLVENLVGDLMNYVQGREPDQRSLDQCSMNNLMLMTDVQGRGLDQRFIRDSSSPLLFENHWFFLDSEIYSSFRRTFIGE